MRLSRVQQVATAPCTVPKLRKSDSQDWNSITHNRAVDSVRSRLLNARGAVEKMPQILQEVARFKRARKP